MNDLTPFGQLSIDDRVALFRAHQEGKTIQVYTSTSRWVDFYKPTWDSESIYRIAPEPPSINWDHVAPEYVALATDGNGGPYLYNVTDIHPDNPRARWLSEANSFRYVPATTFASFKPGTCHWKESLVIRPRIKEEEEEPNRFTNFYQCICGKRWEDESPHTNDDRCPACDTSNSPYESTDL